MEISKETYQQADDKSQRNMLFDLVLDLHETIKGNSKPGCIEKHRQGNEYLKNKITFLTSSVSWIRVFIVGILLAVVGVALK